MAVEKGIEKSLNSDDNINEKNEVLLREGDGFMSAETLTKCKNAVCLIHCETTFRCPTTGVLKRGIKRGSGFYAKAKIFGVEYRCIVTNNHVISCEEDASVAVATFDFEKENQGVPVHLSPNKLFRTNPNLDYAVIGVNEDAMNRLIPRVFPIEYTEQPQAMVGDDIFIFQHPLGGPKQYSYQKITGIVRPFVYYIADTDEGSSGSPVLWKLQLMAIHRVGSKEDGYNKGTLFSEIINDLHRGCNIRNIGVNSKRGIDCVERNSPREMEENTCKKMRVENYKNVDNEHSANMSDEEQPLSPDDETLDKLSQECCGFYQQLGRRLHVTEKKIVEIRKDHINYGSISEKCFQVLQEWKDSNPSQFTNEVLEKALRDLDKNDLANRYFSK